MKFREQRVSKRNMCPSRGERRIHTPHQDRQKLAVRRTPGIVTEVRVPRTERADAPRVASGPRRVFGGRRRWLKVRAGARDFLDRTLIGATSRGCGGAGCDGVGFCRRRRGRRGLRRRCLLRERRQSEKNGRRRDKNGLSAHCPQRTLLAAPRLQSCESAAAWAGSIGRKGRRSRRQGR